MTSLATSSVWQLQRAYYAARGPAAFANEVPSYVSSSPCLANIYGGVIERALLQGRAEGWLDVAAPVFVLELGSGSGELAYRVALEVRSRLRRSAPELRSRFVLTDAVDSMIDGIRAHPAWSSALASGAATVGKFDMARPAPIRLGAREVLAPGKVQNPLFVIANYAFDSAPHDAFCAVAGQLYASHVRLETRATSIVTRQPAPEALALRYSRRRVRERAYSQRALDRAVKACAAEVGDGWFPFPLGALTTLAYLGSLSGTCYVLCADQGAARASAYRGATPPALMAHGGSSYPVNFHAVRTWLGETGGWEETVELEGDFCVALLGVGPKARALPDARRTFRHSLARVSPTDMPAILMDLNTRPPLTSAAARAYLRISRWDPEFLPALAGILASARSRGWRERRRVVRALRRVEARAYLVPERPSPYLVLAEIYDAVGASQDAERVRRRESEHTPGG